MDIALEPGKYVVAVSGGVDSVVLLNVLSNMPDVEVIVAHFDHGIRQDSAEDAEFVKSLAQQKNLPFYSKREELGPRASEELARKQRYAFLSEVKQATDARAIVTAHHQDDVIETALINVSRGTHRRGLTALSSHPELPRPLLDYPKERLISYAEQHKLSWREDSTNTEMHYLRNIIRARLRKRRDVRDEMLALIKNVQVLNTAIDHLLEDCSDKLGDEVIERRLFIQVPYSVACEYMTLALRQRGVEYDAKKVHRLVTAVKTAHAGTMHDVNDLYVLCCEQKQISFQRRSSV